MKNEKNSNGGMDVLHGESSRALQSKLHFLISFVILLVLFSCFSSLVLAVDTTAPTQITDLSASAINRVEIDLSWSPAIDNVWVIGYKVYRNGQEIATVKTSHYYDVGLNASTSYQYQVAAIDTSGNIGSLSNTIATTTLAPSANNIYYVSSTATSTNWNNAKNSNTPCTIDTASENAAAGDIVYFRGGTYGSISSPINFWVVHSGTQSAPIVFSAYPGEKPIIVGGFVADTKQWIRFFGFTVQGIYSPPTTWRDMPVKVIDDASVGWIDPNTDWSTVRQSLAQRKYATYFSWYNNFTTDWTDGIRVSASNNIVVANNEVYYHSEGIVLSGDSSVVIVENNNIHHCYAGIASYEGDYTNKVSVQDTIIRGNYVTQILDEAITPSFNALRVVVQDNVCEYNAVNHLSMHNRGTDIILRHNYVKYGGYYSETMEAEGSSAISVGFGISGGIIENNFAAYEYDDSRWDGNGIIVDSNNVAGGGDVTVQNNIVYRNQGSGITLTRSPNVKVVNNVCIENGQAQTEKSNGAGLRFSSTGSTNAIVVNNIFLNNVWEGIYGAGVLTQQTLIDNNLYVVASGTAAIKYNYDDSQVYTTIADIRTATSFEDHGIQQDPKFVDASIFDYHLLSSSPAISAGNVLYASLLDASGFSRGSTPEIGIYEFIASLNGSNNSNTNTTTNTTSNVTNTTTNTTNTTTITNTTNTTVVSNVTNTTTTNTTSINNTVSNNTTNTTVTNVTNTSSINTSVTNTSITNVTNTTINTTMTNTTTKNTTNTTTGNVVTNTTSTTNSSTTSNSGNVSGPKSGSSGGSSSGSSYGYHTGKKIDITVRTNTTNTTTRRNTTKSSATLTGYNPPPVNTTQNSLDVSDVSEQQSSAGSLFGFSKSDLIWTLMGVFLVLMVFVYGLLLLSIKKDATRKKQLQEQCAHQFAAMNTTPYQSAHQFMHNNSSTKHTHISTSTHHQHNDSSHHQPSHQNIHHVIHHNDGYIDIGDIRKNK